MEVEAVEEVEEVSVSALDQILEAMRSGALSLEDMKKLNQALKPKSEVQIKREAAKASLEAYLNLTLAEEVENGAESVRDIFDNIQTLQAEVKACKGSGVRKATKKWHWDNKADRTNFLIEAEDRELSVHPDNDAEWLAFFRENGFTEGQIAAVRKERPYRKARGILTMEQLIEIT